MALEGGVSHGYPKGAGGKAAASSSACSFLFSLCMLQRSPFDTTFLVMPLAELQNLQWFPIAPGREYKVLSWPPKATPGCSPIPQDPQNCLTLHAFDPALPSGWNAISFLLHLLKSFTYKYIYFKSYS